MSGNDMPGAPAPAAPAEGAPPDPGFGHIPDEIATLRANLRAAEARAEAAERLVTTETEKNESLANALARERAAREAAEGERDLYLRRNEDEMTAAEHRAREMAKAAETAIKAAAAARSEAEGLRQNLATLANAIRSIRARHGRSSFVDDAERLADALAPAAGKETPRG